MKITFFSNYLTHHQIPFCNEMVNLIGNQFTFVSTEPVSIERKNLGWTLDGYYSYELRSYENDETAEKALKHAIDSDVIIIGSAPEYYVDERMKQGNKLTLRYSERIYKSGRWRILSPRGMYYRIKSYFRYINRPLYMLCASAYTSGDLAMLGSYLGKCYKWGYFPESKQYNIDELMRKKQNKKIKILWSGRFLDWKHTEDAIKIAKQLKREGYSFSLDIIGSGELEDHIKGLIIKYNLSDVVNLLGVMKTEQVREYMEQSNIYLFTSDFNEGWGAVLNEAMNSGCAVVASHAIGSVPYLIKNGENGLIYKNGDIDNLYENVKMLMDREKLREQISVNAYKTIIGNWNAKIAAERLLKLIDELREKGKSTKYDNGPCSNAEVLWNNWLRWGKNEYKNDNISCGS
jgi:glycosyltransferase involved in cell wall biosynthesis